MSYKAVIFDFDGVIIDSELVYLERRKKILEELGYKITKEELNELAGLSSANTKAKYREWVPGKENMMLTSHMEYIDDMFNNPSNYVFNDIIDLIKELNNRNIKLALASNNRLKNVAKVLDKLNIKTCFSVVTTREDITATKPNPEIYLTSVRKLGLLPAECVVIEDSKYGIQAAKEAGACVIARKETRFGINQDNADVIAEASEIVSIIDKMF